MASWASMTVHEQSHGLGPEETRPCPTATTGCLLFESPYDVARTPHGKHQCSKAPLWLRLEEGVYKAHNHYIVVVVQHGYLFSQGGNGNQAGTRPVRAEFLPNHPWPPVTSLFFKKQSMLPPFPRLGRREWCGSHPTRRRSGARFLANMSCGRYLLPHGLSVGK